MSLLFVLHLSHSFHSSSEPYKMQILHVFVALLWLASSGMVKSVPSENDPEIRTSTDLLREFEEADASSADLNKLMIALSRFKQQFGGEFKIPYVVIVGPQTTAKSSLLEQFLQTPSNVVKQGTATRAPLEIHLERDLTTDYPAVTFEGEQIDIRQIFSKILERTATIENSAGFSKKVLKLHIRSKEVPDMVLLDTPGLIPNSKDPQAAKMVEEIVKEQIKDPHRIIVCLSKAGDQETHFGIKWLSDAFEELGQPDWKKRTVFVYTWFDKYVTELRTGRKANDFFSQADKGLAHFYLSLAPPTLPVNLDETRAETSYEMLKERIRSIPTHEKDMFDKWLNDMKENNAQASSPEEFNFNRHGPTLGIQNFRNYITKLYTTRFLESLPASRLEARKKFDLTDAEIAEKEKLLKSIDAGNLRRTLEQYIRNFVRKSRELTSGLEATEFRNDDRFRDVVGQTLEEETKNFTSDYFFSKDEKSWSKYLPTSAAPKAHVAKADRSLSGSAQFSRLLMYFKEIARNLQPLKLQLHEWQNSQDTVGNTAPAWMKMIAKVTTEQLRIRLAPLSKWITWRAAYILDRIQDYTEQVMLDIDEYRRINEYQTFREQLRASYRSIISDIRADCERVQDENIKQYTSMWIHDLAWQISHVHPQEVAVHIADPTLAEVMGGYSQSETININPASADNSPDGWSGWIPGAKATEPSAPAAPTKSSALSRDNHATVVEEMAGFIVETKEINKDKLAILRNRQHAYTGPPFQVGILEHQHAQYLQQMLEDNYNAARVGLIERLVEVLKARMYLYFVEDSTHGTGDYNTPVENELTRLVSSDEKVLEYITENPADIKKNIERLNGRKEELNKVLRLFEKLQKKLQSSDLQMDIFVLDRK
eukprot:TRINITY_DN5312_c0_g1_i2.p1 TRINITY_DN5312_c0_g1~~TRINITY_DN5312_c0_g1_i2.p1  ORF type:complete len:880 (+),score=185.43 TRINITY_DN5312_c0_g1_i2:27-2666(+)